jgi:hypothetical protein
MGRLVGQLLEAGSARVKDAPFSQSCGGALHGSDQRAGLLESETEGLISVISEGAVLCLSWGS